MGETKVVRHRINPPAEMVKVDAEYLRLCLMDEANRRNTSYTTLLGSVQVDNAHIRRALKKGEINKGVLLKLCAACKKDPDDFLIKKVRLEGGIEDKCEQADKAKYNYKDNVMYGGDIKVEKMKLPEGNKVTLDFNVSDDKVVKLLERISILLEVNNVLLEQLNRRWE